jgi:hypothetical protein
VSGGGTLDGQEDMWNWRPWKKGYWGEPWVDDRGLDASYGQQGVLNQMNWADVPIEQRVFTDDGRQPGTMRSAFRPSFIQPNHSTNVLIEDVRIRNTPFWTVHLLNSRNVLVRGLDIYSNKATGYEARGWNNDDGINPESSRNVVLENNHVSVSDDGTAIKAGRNRNGREHRAPSERIIIRDSVYQNDSANSAAVSVGSEMSGSVRDVFIHDNRFGGTGMAVALKFKTNAYRGGVVENIYLRDSVLENTTTSLVELNANYSETVPLPNADLFNPTIRDIFVDRVDREPRKDLVQHSRGGLPVAHRERPLPRLDVPHVEHARGRFRPDQEPAKPRGRERPLRRPWHRRGHPVRHHAAEPAGRDHSGRRPPVRGQDHDRAVGDVHARGQGRLPTVPRHRPGLRRPLHHPDPRDPS